MEDKNNKMSCVQVLAWLKKLEKSLKKANKKGRKCCRHKESDSNSTSCWSVELGSNKENKNGCKKVKLNHELSNHTTTDLIETTNSLNFQLNSKLNNDKNLRHLENLFLKILKKTWFCQPTPTWIPMQIWNFHQNRCIWAESTEDKHGPGNCSYASCAKNSDRKSVLNKALTLVKELQKNHFLRVLLDKGSESDLRFHEKGTTKHLPYLTREMPKFWHTLSMCFHSKQGGQVTILFMQ